MMNEMGRADDRRATAEYWDDHGIDAVLPEDVEVDIEVKKPLSAVISVRMDPGHVEKLRRLARDRSFGVTTMARKIIERELDESGRHADRQPFSEAWVRDTVAGAIAETREPYEPGGHAYFMLTNEDIESVAQMLQDAVGRLVVAALREKSVSATQDASEIYERLRELENSGE